MLIEREEAIKLLRGKCVGKYPTTFLPGLFAAADEILKLNSVDAVQVVRCEKCEFWLEESKERCERLGSQQFGWCLRNRNIDDMDWREHRYHYDYCSQGRQKGELSDADSDCD